MGGGQFRSGWTNLCERVIGGPSMQVRLVEECMFSVTQSADFKVLLYLQILTTPHIIPGHFHCNLLMTSKSTCFEVGFPLEDLEVCTCNCMFLDMNV